jgi:hypothetical protein
VGVDHGLSSIGAEPYGELVVIDTAASTAACGEIPAPNTAYVLDAITPSDLGRAMFSAGSLEFTDELPARLQRSSARLFNGGARPPVEVGDGLLVDDNPLWSFIDDSDDDVPDSCRSTQFDDDMSDVPPVVRKYFEDEGFAEAGRQRRLLQRCLTHYNGSPWDDRGRMAGFDPVVGCGPETVPVCSGVVFGRNSSSGDEPDLFDIQYSPRFGYVAHEEGGYEGTTDMQEIGHFEPVFLQRVVGRCALLRGCDLDFEPGVPYLTGGTDDGVTTADGVTAFMLPSSSMPGDLGLGRAPFAIGVNRFVELVR